MPFKKRHSKLVLTITVVLGLIPAAILYVTFSDDKATASEDIWLHFKALSLFVAGYYFGQNRG